MLHFTKKLVPHLIFLALLIVLISATYRDYGIAWDENRFLSTGKYHLSNLLNTLGIRNNLIDDTDRYYYFDIKAQTASHGVLYDMLMIGTTVLLKKVNLETFHLIRGLLAVPTFILLAATVAALLDPRYGFLSMVFLLLFPRFFGNMFVSPIDIPTTLFFALASFYFIYFTKSNQSRGKQIVLGAILALAINQRLILAYLFGLAALTLFLIEIFQKKKQWAQLVAKTAIISLSTLLFMHLTHPHLLTHPLTGLIDMIKLNASFPFNAAVLFDGTFIHAADLPWYYIPKYILITTPLATVALALVGTMYLMYGILHEKDPTDRATNLYILSLLFVPLLAILLLKPVLYDSWRLFLFLTIPIIVIAMLGLSRLMRIKSRAVKIILSTLIAANLVTTAWEMKVLHPYEYVYFNELVGGLAGADGKYETDYWALANREAILWFNQNIANDGQEYAVMAEGDPFSISYYAGQNIKQTYEPGTADYHVSFTRWDRHKVLPGKIVHTISRRGVPLVFIKKLE